jgi:hypothetical protein
MKTLKNSKGTKFVRVPDKKAHEIEGILDLLEKGWTYCPKSEWKKKSRDALESTKMVASGKSSAKKKKGKK